MPEHNLYLSFVAKQNPPIRWMSAHEVRVTAVCPLDRSEELENKHQETGVYQSWECIKITLKSPEEQHDKPSTVHVVFHYHDNCCDCTRAFADLEQAQKDFQEQEQEMWEIPEVDVAEGERCNGGYAYAVFKKNKWHCEVLEHDKSGWWGESWCRPDKGSTWWMMSLPIQWNSIIG